MKLAVVTITVGDVYEEIATITHPTLKAYAEKIGAEFIVWGDQRDHTLPHYLKMGLNKLLREYDRVLYIDTDILVRPDAPNIFEETPEDHIGIFEEGQFIDRSSMKDFLTEHGIDVNKWNGKYYNTGVMVLSSEHANVFLPPVHEKNHFKEQSYINLLFALMKPKIYNFHYKWNRMYALDRITGEERFDSYFMHYAGLSEMMPKDAFLTLMKNDWEEWGKGKEHGYKYQKNVAIFVQGGLGDQIAAEPAVRWVKNHLYKGDNLLLISDWPELFGHLDITIKKAGEKFQVTKGFVEFQTLRSPDHVSWEYMSHPLCHTTDFASLQLARCTLPVTQKQISLPLDKKIVDNMRPLFDRRTVLLHPGRGWPSKTFPSDVWQSWLDALLEVGLNVVLVGKELNDEQGVVRFDWEKPGVTSLISKLSIAELIAAVSLAPVLISNDSAPIHIAGAFDNWIGVVATCKRPDHILPYRGNGDPFYKAEALEEYKLYERYNAQPTQVYGATIDKCTDEQIRAACPGAKRIVDFVFKALTNG